MAKYTLHSDANLFDFVLIGLSSMENQYVIVNNINNTLCIDLNLEQTLKFNLKKQDLFEFSLFQYIDEELGLEYFLVPNKSNYKSHKQKESDYDLFTSTKQVFEETALLISELPRTDYFLLLKGENAIHEQYKVFTLLKQIPCIQQVHEIIPDKLQSKNNLVF